MRSARRDTAQSRVSGASGSTRRFKRGQACLNEVSRLQATADPTAASMPHWFLVGAFNVRRCRIAIPRLSLLRQECERSL